MAPYGIRRWGVAMRGYHRGPVFSPVVAPSTLGARRRTIYVFFDRGMEKGIERIALGGTSQGGLYDAVRSTKPVAGPAGVGGRQAELWGDEQWQVLKKVIEERQPKVIGIDKSRTFAFADGLSSGELEGMSEAQLAQSITAPNGSKSAFEMVIGIKEHEMHHRAQLFLMERMIGIVPHLTRARQERMAQMAKA